MPQLFCVPTWYFSSALWRHWSPLSPFPQSSGEGEPRPSGYRWPCKVNAKCQISISTVKCGCVNTAFRRGRGRAGVVFRPVTFATLCRRQDVDSSSLRNGKPPVTRIILERRENWRVKKETPYLRCHSADSFPPPLSHGILLHLFPPFSRVSLSLSYIAIIVRKELCCIWH